MSPRILVTGGSGFIGGHVVAALRESRGGDVPPPVRLVLRDPGSLPRGVDPADAPAADVVRADLTDPSSLRGVCDGVDVVLHCASHIGADERLTEAVNDHGTRALVEEATRAGVARVVYVSTAAVYGQGPFTAAPPGGPPLAPASPTSRSRVAAERHVLDAGGVVLRPHLVLGAGDRWVVPGLVAVLGLLSAPLKGCAARHSVVDVRALGRAVLAAGLSERELSGVHHVNHPRPVDSSELLDTVADLLDLHLPGAPLDIEEARTRLAGQPRALHHLDLLAVDHWFADDGFWAGVGADPGTGFARGLSHHEQWYRQFLYCSTTDRGSS
ncbi:NAD(P)-dependent oxidoreductase [Streptomyces sp. AC550_RSS872]|uniref:NAD-dependent epimerase/dehydratase family protein n=1 Tax=Streptomyces sp. AC550_RSS872 TaxID=2823689 RepID=UPI001C267D81|nr:NAD-dependent epimerase/dehydratase family protein [Streptomyces sp. AC550_RSS872]